MRLAAASSLWPPGGDPSHVAAREEECRPNERLQPCGRESSGKDAKRRTWRPKQAGTITRTLQAARPPCMEVDAGTPPGWRMLPASRPPTWAPTLGSLVWLSHIRGTDVDTCASECESRKGRWRPFVGNHGAGDYRPQTMGMGAGVARGERLGTAVLRSGDSRRRQGTNGACGGKEGGVVMWRGKGGVGARNHPRKALV